MAWMRQDSNSDTPGQRFTPDPPVDVVRERKNFSTQPAAHIGKTVLIQGEVHSEEDLVVDGRVEGKLYVKKNRLTLGASAKIHGDVQARWVVVSGEVEGDVKAGDRLEITTGGWVHGDVHAPRLIVAEGARLQGAVDTDPVQSGKHGGKEKEKASAPESAQQARDRSTEHGASGQQTGKDRQSGNGQRPGAHSGSQGGGQ